MEVSLAPSPFPGTNAGGETPIAFFDAFAYSAGDLTGQGTWQAAPGNDSNVVVSSGIVQTAVSTDAANQSAALIPGLDATKPIDATITVRSATTQPASDGVYELYLAGAGSVFCGIGVSTNIADAGAGNAIPQFFDTGGGTTMGAPFTWARNATHTIRWHVEAGIATIYVDGILRLTASAPGMNLIVTPSLAFSIGSDPTNLERVNSVSGTYFS